MPDYLAPWHGSRSLIANLEVGDGVTSIGAAAFKDCPNLMYAALANSVTGIGDSAFYASRKLVYLNVPSALERIGAMAFANCYMLPGFTLPAGVSRIGEGAFAGCRAMTAFNVDPSNTEYVSVDSVLYSRDMKLLLAYPPTRSDAVFTVPDGVESIAASAFATSGNLVEVRLPESILRIGNGAFAGCMELVKINIPKGLKIIQPNVFTTCRKLANVDLAHVYAIGEGAFAWCSALTAVDLSNLQSIGDMAFFHCENLASIKITALLVEIGREAFGQCYGFKGFDVDKNNPSYSSENGVLYDKEQTTLIVYPPMKDEEEFTVPQTINTIAAYAFNGSAFTAIDLANVKTIRHDAFLNSHLKSVDLAGVEGAIEESTFSGSKDLASVKIPEAITSIGDSVFSGCTALETVEAAAVVPYAISASAFEDVDLTRATLHVPTGAKAAYRSAEVWKEFGKILDGSGTSAEAVRDDLHIYMYKNTVYVGSNSAETIEIYSVTGSLLYRGMKPAGTVMIETFSQDTVLIVKGSSGWSRKVAR
jgi:hypothetical protein